MASDLPFDDKSPFVTSGIRVGTPAITTRGLKEDEMAKVVELVDRVLTNPQDEKEIETVREEVKKMMAGKPLFNS